jgi:hypothetical protein
VRVERRRIDLGGVLGIPAMDGHLDRQSPTPPRHTLIAEPREGPCLRLRVGVPQNPESAVHVVEVPRTQVSVGIRRRIHRSEVHELAGAHHSRHPREDPARMANQTGEVPFGTLWHGSRPVGLGSFDQLAAIHRSRVAEVKIVHITSRIRLIVPPI